MTLPGDEPVTAALGGSVEVSNPPPSARIPGAVEIVSRGLDLNLAISGQLRRFSLYVGAMFLVTLGPIAAVLGAITVRLGSVDWLVQSFEDRRAVILDLDVGPAPVVLAVGGLCVLAVSIDVQNLAAAIIGARATGRRVELRPALAIARLGFWRLAFASIAVALLLLIPRQLVGSALGSTGPAGQEVRQLLATAADVVLSAPFAYLGASVVLGGEGPVSAIRRSWRLARRRWRLALVIGIVNTAVSYIAGFAVGAGADILARIATAFGLADSTGAASIVGLAAVVAIAIFALGSLVMTIAALSVAPQVVAYLGLGGSTSALDVLGGDPTNPSRTARTTPLVTRGMKVALAVLALAMLGAIVRLY
jgi:hypothetical protein